MDDLCNHGQTSTSFESWLSSLGIELIEELLALLSTLVKLGELFAAFLAVFREWDVVLTLVEGENGNEFTHDCFL
jgi:hypothetical protein